MSLNVTTAPRCDLSAAGGVRLDVPIPDGELVARIRQGDRDAFATLLARYQDRFVRYARHLLGNREDAEEAVQDAFVRAYRSIGRCDPNRLGAWLYRILLNRCRTVARRRRWWHRGARDVDHAVGLTAPMDRDPTWPEEIDRALATLPVKQREAFLLKHVDELEYHEMSDITGASISALKMRVSRACEQLRSELEDSR